MEQYRTYTDPQDENDVTNKRYVDKKINEQIEKVENDIDNRFKKSLGNIIVDDISCKNLFNIKGDYTQAVNYPTITDNSITLPSSDGNGGYTKFSQLIPVDGPITLSATISNGGGFARFLLIPLDSSKNVITDLEIGSGYTYLPYYGGYWNDSPDGYYSLTLNFPENVKYFQLGFVHVSATFTNVQIEKGSTATPYAPYKSLGYTSGTNENGSWVKYDDGRLEVQGTGQCPANVGYADITFPMAFIDTNYIMIANHKYTGESEYGGSSQLLNITNPHNYTTTQAYIYSYLYDGSFAGYPRNVQYIAKGRWK